MKKTTIIILAVIAVVALYLLVSYNGFVSSKENIDSKWAQVENQLQRRFDLIPNLVETVKGVAKQEQTVFGDLAAARAKYAGATNQSDKVAAANQYQDSISRLLVVVENYPQLKSSEAYNNLMTQLEGTENRISVERMNYNNAVQVFNTKIKRFPGNILARTYGFSAQQYFQINDVARENPQVKF